MDVRETVLSKEQQELLNKKKIELSISNEKYLRDHPEIGGMVYGFTKYLLEKRPEDVLAAAKEYFCKDD